MTKNKLTISNSEVKKLADELKIDYTAKLLSKPKFGAEGYRYYLELAKKGMPIISQVIAQEEKIESDQELIMFLAELCRQVRDTDEYKNRRKEIFELRKKIDELNATEVSAYTQISRILKLEEQVKLKNMLHLAGDESKESLGFGDTDINIGLLERNYRDIRLLNLHVKKRSENESASAPTSNS